MSFQGLVFLQASLSEMGRNSIFHFWATSRSLQTNGLEKNSILNTIYECFTGIGVNELRNMSWNKRAPPLNKRRPWIYAVWEALKCN